MSWELLLLLGALTYGSRVLAVALLPRVPGRAAAVLDRMPAALFAGLAAQSLIGPDGVMADPAVMVAAAGALVVSPFRSLPICLAAGLLAFGAASVVL